MYCRLQHERRRHARQLYIKLYSIYQITAYVHESVNFFQNYTKVSTKLVYKYVLSKENVLLKQ